VPSWQVINWTVFFFLLTLHSGSISGLWALPYPMTTSDLYNALLRAWNDDTYTSHGALNRVRYSTACQSSDPFQGPGKPLFFSFSPPRPEPAVVPNPSPVPCVDALTFYLSLPRHGKVAGAVQSVSSPAQAKFPCTDLPQAESLAGVVGGG
jgi:hypothetical protein